MVNFGESIMSDTLSTLADEKGIDRKRLEGAIKQILKQIIDLEDEQIEKNQWFKKLNDANLACTQEQSILELLTDDDLLEIIDAFQKIQNVVSKKIAALEKDGGELSRLKEQSVNMGNTINARNKEILRKQAELDQLNKNPLPPAPGFWTNFMASIGDMEPGLAKSFLLLFVSEKNVQASQIIRNSHAEPARERQGLAETISSLESEKAKLEKSLSSTDADIHQNEKNLGELKEHLNIFDVNVPILVESAASLVSTEKQQQAAEAAATDRVIDELDFDSIARQPFG